MDERSVSRLVVVGLPWSHEVCLPGAGAREVCPIGLGSSATGITEQDPPVNPVDFVQHLCGM
jgi:hypothetical protein